MRHNPSAETFRLHIAACIEMEGLNALQTWRWLRRELGFPYSYTVVQEYVKKHHPAPARRWNNQHMWKTHCIRGHSLADAYLRIRGGRVFRACRECVRLANAGRGCISAGRGGVKFEEVF